jgi:hypothetical protein
MSVSRPHHHSQGVRTSADSAAIKVDRNYSYAVFVSYAEVYNEKV